MDNIDEKIHKFMSKNVEAKTILVDPKDYNNKILEYKNDGWSLVKECELNGRIKLTFERIK
jgi:hypothetical protein